MVRGMLCWIRAIARVRPDMPPPTMAMLKGFCSAMIVVAVEKERLGFAAG